jgi:hypothetical protein
MKTLSGRQYTFEEVTQFPSQNKVIDTPVSNIHLSLTRHAVVVPFIERGDLAQSDIPHT